MKKIPWKTQISLKEWPALYLMKQFNSYLKHSWKDILGIDLASLVNSTKCLKKK